VRAILRFLASVMMVSGLLLISDAGATLLWQEPVSWYLVKHQQHELELALASPPQRVIHKKPLKGDAIGKITIPRIKLSKYVVEGTDTASLRKGPGHYPSTPLPGQRGTVAIAGHRTTYGAPFRHVDSLRRHDRIVVDMPYGRFIYRVQRLKIVDDQDLSVLRKKSYNRLVLSACHPLYSAAQRIIVFARQQRELPARVRKRKK
jgi:sortase A